MATLRRRGGDERHRTLDAAVDWSYRLLDRSDQFLLARLSVFRSPVTAETVRVVCADDDVPPTEIDERLRRLADRSLCEVAHDEDPPRYRLLESIRRFAADRLDAEPRGDGPARRALLHWARGTVEREFVRLGTPETAQGMAALRAEHGNLLAALDWAIDSPDEADEAALARRRPGEVLEYERRVDRRRRTRRPPARAVDTEPARPRRDRALPRRPRDGRLPHRPAARGGGRSALARSR